MDTKILELRIQNKDVFTTLIVLFLISVLIIPLFNKLINNLLKRLEMIEKTIRVWLLNIQQTMWNTVLNEEQTINLLLTNMWFVSYGKLKFIKQIMVFNHISWRRQEIKEKIKLELWQRSNDYLHTFKQYITPIWDLSIWLEKNFWEKEFDEFIEKIVHIVYSEKYNENYRDRDSVIEYKTNEIADLMKTTQFVLWNKLKEDMKNYKI
jgi:hypothetical protein